MRRGKDSSGRAKTVALIWIISAFLFYYASLLAYRNSSFTNPISSDGMNLNMERRSKLYDKMAKDLDEHGAVFLKGGETSQSLSLSDIFDIRDGSVVPRLKAANPPVRANVLCMSEQYSIPISESVKDVFLPYFPDVIWFQNRSLYHFSMFHASHHIISVPASDDEIETEVSAVQRVAKITCPLKIKLDRVVLTSTGVLLGCWQVISGTDPITIRSELRTALPRAPEKQLYDAAILHTSFARILDHPKTSSKAEISELWFVEEYDVLALALNGSMKLCRFHLGCSRQQKNESTNDHRV